STTQAFACSLRTQDAPCAGPPVRRMPRTPCPASSFRRLHRTLTNVTKRSQGPGASMVRLPPTVESGAPAPDIVLSSPHVGSTMTDLAALTARVEKLEHELAIQQDIHQIRRVQYTYGFFIDKSMYEEVVDLFSDDG